MQGKTKLNLQEKEIERNGICTGDESDVPGWDAFDPSHWSKLWG